MWIAERRDRLRAFGAQCYSRPDNPELPIIEVSSHWLSNAPHPRDPPEQKKIFSDREQYSSTILTFSRRTLHTVDHKALCHPKCRRGMAKFSLTRPEEGNRLTNQIFRENIPHFGTIISNPEPESMIIQCSSARIAPRKQKIVPETEK